MKTLDEILTIYRVKHSKLINLCDDGEITEEQYSEGLLDIRMEAKQQINKWALEKCLEVIGNDLDNYEIVGIKISDIINGILRQQREKARKEFSNDKA